ncbi:MAG: hypothetical protein LBN39_11910 [Planctomycetaceae bacterium]|jgi:hypothetical protein|nr:hypothetical protein [Planctomycetaceae bacterium]
MQRLLLCFCFVLFCSFVSAAEPVKHKLLLLDESRGQMLYVDQTASEKNWCIALEGGKAWGLQLTGDNRVLVAMPTQGGYREYDLTTQKVVREKFDKNRYGGAMSAIRLPDGRTVLACDRDGAGFFVFDEGDKEIAAWNFQKFIKIRQIRRTNRDTLLFGSNTDKIYETDLTGKILKETTLPDAQYIYQISELPNGNKLAAAGYGGFLAEIDKDNNAVKRWGGKPEPAGLLFYFMSQFQVLKNGNIVAATWTGHGADDSKKGQQVAEFAPDGKVVWTWHDPQLAGSIHGVIVLDDLDTKQFYNDAGN